MRIVFLGGPGTGKSTVGKRLAADLKWDWVSSGEILRQSSEEWVIERLKTAELFDDEMVAGLVFSRLHEVENAIIDGFPRTLRQAELMTERNVPVDLMVEMSVPKDEAITRILARGRDQDTKEIAEERWAEYMQKEIEVKAFMVGSGVPILQIDGVGTEDEVYKRAVNQILAALKGEVK